MGLISPMIKEVAEEIGVHLSQQSLSSVDKQFHTPQGFELRYFFRKPSKAHPKCYPLLIQRRVKKMLIERRHVPPATDEQITACLQSEGIDVTWRTVLRSTGRI